MDGEVAWEFVGDGKTHRSEARFLRRAKDRKALGLPIDAMAKGEDGCWHTYRYEEEL